VSGGPVCGLEACATQPAHSVSLHALPAFWPGLILAVLTLLWWVNEKLREPDDGMEVVVEFEPWDDDE
jgi:hypothetical protein